MDQDYIQKQRDENKRLAERGEELKNVKNVGDQLDKALNFQTSKLIANAATRTNKIKSVDPIASPDDIKAVVDGLNQLGDKLAPKELKPVVEALEGVIKEVGKLPKKYPDFPAFPKFPDLPKTTKVDNLSEIKPWLEAIVTAVGKIEVSPEIEVKPADVTIPETKVDLTPVTQGLIDVKKALDKIKLPETDFSKLEEAVQKTTTAINSLSFPVPNYVLPFKDINGAATQVQLTTSGKVPVDTAETGATSLYENSTPLLANGNVVSDWIDVSTYTYITAVLYSDQNSATSGAKILLSSDGGTTTEKSLANSFTGGIGAFSYAIPTGAYDAIKFDFTNGGTNQTAFHVIIYGNKGANPVPVAPLGAGIDPTLSGVLTRSILAAQNPTGTMSNLITTAGGYLRNSIAQIEIDVPIAAMTALNIKQESIGTSAVQITAVATDRKTISIKARSSNTDLVFVGTTDSVTSSNGYELAAGDAVEFDLTEGQAIWCIGGAVSQTICVAEVS